MEPTEHPMIPNRIATMNEPSLSSTRRDWLVHAMKATAIGATHAMLTGCIPGRKSETPYQVDAIIGQRGMADGRFQKPRAIAIDDSNRAFVVDKTGRIQVFDEEGTFVRGWRTPEIEQGKPTGLSIDLDGTLIVADTHYFRFLFYTAEGNLLDERTIGGVNGSGPGKFAFVTDAVRLPSGEFVLGEYGEFDRIHKYSPNGEYIASLGEHGREPLQFSRPQSLAVDTEGWLWVADACNHRVQVIDWTGDKPRCLRMFGEEGDEPGQFKYPYSLALFGDGLLVSEYGNHRVQRLDRNGKSVATWGQAGSKPGELNQPWAIAVDTKERIYVVDSGNNRIQRFYL
ncbi:Serine/threonine-protein kinase PknD [Pirellula sp. SH-Sr6A]|nr:Serine/threonine-protein kinase PknD [Pirellula sp. SH-Sr6A]